MAMSLVNYYYFNKVGEFCSFINANSVVCGYLCSPLYFISANHFPKSFWNLHYSS